MHPIPKNLNLVTFEDFEPYLEQIFSASIAENEKLELKLIEVSKTGPSPFKDYRASFSLLFQNLVHSNYEQQLFKITHPTKGVIDIFLVPVIQKPNGAYYQAVFS